MQPSVYSFNAIDITVSSILNNKPFARTQHGKIINLLMVAIKRQKQKNPVYIRSDNHQLSSDVIFYLVYAIRNHKNLAQNNRLSYVIRKQDFKQEEWLFTFWILRIHCLRMDFTSFQIPEFDNLYLDMNGIIHVCSHPEDDNPHFRITEEKIFKDIFHYLEVNMKLLSF